MEADVFAVRLSQIRARFTSTLERKVEETEAGLSTLSGSEATAISAVAETYRRLHGIAGTGPTVGFAATGQAARTAEDILIEAYRSQRALTESESAGLKQALVVLRQAAQTELEASSVG